MHLPREGIEHWSLTLTTTPAVDPDQWELSVDGKVTWHAGIVDPDNSARARWTLAGPDATDLPDGVIQVLDDVEPDIRHIDDPERIYRHPPKIFITD